jgi:hypothetical protein
LKLEVYEVYEMSLGEKDRVESSSTLSEHKNRHFGEEVVVEGKQKVEVWIASGTELRILS